MKSVAIVSVADMRHMSMISLYTELFEKAGIQYDIICTDRYMDKEQQQSGVYAMAWGLKEDASKFRKILPFIAFASHAKKIIAERKYDFLVIWNENTAILLWDLLTGPYKGRYCVNIRDIGIDNQAVLRFLKGAVIRRSSFSTICSPPMTRFLPAFDYTLIMSQNQRILHMCTRREAFRERGLPIRITYIGKVRFLQEDRRIIEAFGNDDRFLVQYFGIGAERLHDFVVEKGYTNVKLLGLFPLEMTGSLLEQTDIINAYYGVSTFDLRVSTSIKLNYAPYLRVPALVTPGTYSEELANGFGFGYSVRNFDSLAEDLYNWYHSLDFGRFQAGCDEFCSYVESVNQKFESLVLQRLEGN